MPPKKQKPKPCPVVVGTVSTRSTRRQSIVNIEIPAKSRYIPKVKKSCATPIENIPTTAKCISTKEKSPEKQSEISLPSTSTKIINPQKRELKLSAPEKKVRGKTKKNPTILEILKDWSDDESSQNSSESAENVQFSCTAGDKQRLISILEGSPRGNQSPEREISTKQDVAIVVSPHIETPDIEESVVIEECVVDDNSCIILDEPDIVTEFVTEEIAHEEVIISSDIRQDIVAKHVEIEVTQDTEQNIVMETQEPGDSRHTSTPLGIKTVEHDTLSSTPSQEVKLKEERVEQVKKDRKVSCSQETIVDEFKSIVEEMKKTSIDALKYSGNVDIVQPLTESARFPNEVVKMNTDELKILPAEVEVTESQSFSTASQENFQIETKTKSCVAATISGMDSSKEIGGTRVLEVFTVDAIVKHVVEENVIDREIKESVINEKSLKLNKTLSVEESRECSNIAQDKTETKNIETSAEKQEQVDNKDFSEKVPPSKLGDENFMKQTPRKQTKDLLESLMSQEDIGKEQCNEDIEKKKIVTEQHDFIEESLCSRMSEGLQVTESTKEMKTVVGDDKIEQDILELKVKELNIADSVNVTAEQNQDEIGGTEAKEKIAGNLKTPEIVEEKLVDQNVSVGVKDSITISTFSMQESKDTCESEIIFTSEQLNKESTAKDIVMQEIKSDPNANLRKSDCAQEEKVAVKEEKSDLLEDQKNLKTDSDMTVEDVEMKESLTDHSKDNNESKMHEQLVAPESTETKDKEGDSTEKTKSAKAKFKRNNERQTRWSLRVKDIPKEPEKAAKQEASSTPPAAIKDEKAAKVPKVKTPRPKQPKKQTPAKDPKVESKSPKEPKQEKDIVIKEPKKKKATATKKAKDTAEKKDKKAKTFEEALKEERRRSNRIKSITVQKKPEVINTLIRSKSDSALNESQLSDKSLGPSDSEKCISGLPKASGREKLSKSRTKSTENLSTVLVTSSNLPLPVVPDLGIEKMKPPQPDPEVTARLKQFVHLKENSYKTDRQTCKEAKKMICDCFLSEEISKNTDADEQVGCGDDCLNRLLLIECGNLCPLGDRCTNKRFQKGLFAPLEVFNTDKKGLGLRAAANIPYGEFILEYVGEVLDPDEFDKRAENYSNVKNIHYYFMSLRSDAIIDATMKGNISRFINHSCDPNAETQKWTVNGELRIGFFSTRTILAGEEVTFDYRFQRYGKEAQKCYCEAQTCRGWLGDSPDDEESEDEEDEEEIEEEPVESGKDKAEKSITETSELTVKGAEEQTEETVAAEAKKNDVVTIEKPALAVTVTPVKRKLPKRKPRKDIFEDLDQLEEEIDMLVTTGLKNQAHTLKLSRLMVRAKEPEQRKKLLRVLRRGELPCRRLFLDYHGLRLMHGYMIDAQHLASANKKFESLRLEMLQTLAVLPIPNKTMLQDSKVLPSVEKWATNKNLEEAIEDSDSNSPKSELSGTPVGHRDHHGLKEEDAKKDEVADPAILDQEEEIKFLASKLVEEWSNLKEVFKIPKKERIEQMKEHEREANRKFMASSYAPEQETSRKNDHRYRTWSKFKSEKEYYSKKGHKPEDKDRPSAAFLKISKHERRKLFALQMEVREEERRMKQREMWRQHELNCMLLGMDPRFTAPFDPSKGYQCIWNPTMGQWQNYPLPPDSQAGFGTPPSSQGMALPNINIPPPQRSGLLGYRPPMGITTSMMGQVQPPSPMLTGMSSGSASQMKLPGLPGTITSHQPIPTALPLYQEVKIEEDPSKVKFAGPIPPPVKLPPKWKCAKDKYGRPYYYHVRLRKSQWEPPPFPEEVECKFSSESSSSSDTSSLSSDSSSENSDTDDEIDDTQLLMEVRKQMERTSKLSELVKSSPPIKQEPIKIEEVEEPSPTCVKNESDEEEIAEEKADVVEKFDEDMDIDVETEVPVGQPEEEQKLSSIDIRLKEVFNLRDDTPELESKPPKKKRRMGLCQEITISPRSEEDKQQFKEDLKRYKANKEKLKRQKELILQQTRKQLREISSASTSSGPPEQKKTKEKRHRSSLKTRMKEMTEINSEHAKKIKETFRSNMATTVVGVLNSYRKPDCREARITNTEEFKHLARKLTHFVMLKEIKHIENIEDLVCTDNVKAKAREYIKKYMSKFGEVYQKRHDEPDFKD